MNKLKVLSLFDGISCGRAALERAGIPIEYYFASEIKQDALRVSNDNYPNIIQLGDIKDIDPIKLPKFDLVIFGSPCQNLSQAMKNRDGLKGKESSLFFEAVRILEVVKPKYFLMENVAGMPQEDKDIISKILGVEPIKINSLLVSAQLRSRLYWTNIPNVDQPTDKGILLKDILESGYTKREKARAILESDSRPLRDPVRMLHRFIETGMTTVIFENKELCEACHTNRIGWNAYKEKGDHFSVKEGDVRYFTQVELERLQTLPEGYTQILNRNRAAGVIGDAWTVDVIAHIFNKLKDCPEWKI